MSFLDEVKAEAAKVSHGTPCTTRIMLEALDADLRADVDKALAMPEIPTTAILTRLKARGYDVPAAQSANRHLRGDCSCG